MLSDVTVLELGSSTGVGYCGRLLTDLGARVLRVEDAEGDALRRTEPAYAAYLHGGKGSLTSTPDPSELLDRWRGRFMVLVVDDSDQRLIDAARTVRGHDRDVLVASITSYGLSGPWAGLPATDFTLQAEAGAALVHPTGTRPPVVAGVELAELAAGAAAVQGIVSALLMAEAGMSLDPHMPVDVDVSRFEAVVALQQVPWLWSLAEGAAPYHVPFSAVPGIEPAADGWVCAIAVTDPQWSAFREMAAVPELFDPRFNKLTSRIALADEVRPLISNFTSKHTIDELVHLGVARRVPITPVGTPETVARLEPYASRGFYLTAPGGGVQPGSPVHWAGERRRPRSLPPIGSDDYPGPGGRSIARAAASRLPLDGLRVLEFATFQAGPLVGVSLTSLGADVIKIESIQRPDLFRFGGTLPIDRAWERNVSFHVANLGKRNITLDLNDPQSMEIVHSLICRSDVVLDNFLPRVLDGYGLDYDGLRALKSDIVMVRMPAWGCSGAWRDRPGFTYSVDATSGLSELTGYPDGDPLMTGTIIDPFAAMHSSAAALAAVRRKLRTGAGGLVEIPLCDAAAQLTARAVAAACGGDILTRRGNDSDQAVPQDIYATLDGQWVAISVPDDATWAAFAALAEIVEWAGDPGYAYEAGRRLKRNEITGRLNALCAGSRAIDVVERLRGAAIPAAVVSTGEDLHEHPQLVARGRVMMVDHAVVGKLPFLGPPARLATSPQATIRSGAPLLGQHNREVLRELGFTDARIDALYDGDHIGDVPLAVR